MFNRRFFFILSSLLFLLISSSHLISVSAQTCIDNDLDGYGNPGNASCPKGNKKDCDDNDNNVYPGAAEICDGKDTNCDGWKPATDVDKDGDKVTMCANDCNDNDPTVYPKAPELCDGKDNNCDYSIPVNERDIDADGYRTCGVPPDCNDNNRYINPGMQEWCSDTKDNNCNSQVDETPCICPDADNDGFTASFCGGTDCDDVNNTVYPGAPELCTDGKDNDCDGLKDCADPNAVNCPPITDADGDGYDVAGICGTKDCDDGDANVHAGAAEICDGKDSNCDGWKAPSDKDTDGDGAAVCAGDCNDNNVNISPLILERHIGDPLCSDNLDNDCDGRADATDSGCTAPGCNTKSSPKDAPHFFTLLNPDNTVHSQNSALNCGKCHADDFNDPVRFACQRCHADPADTSDPLNGTLKTQYPLAPPYGYGSAPNISMHSSSVVGTRYGNWTMGEQGCVTCHNPHAQEQNNIFGTDYGMFIKEYVCFNNPVTGLNIQSFVEFTSNEGTGSFADGDTRYEGVCEICHTQTTHFRNDGSGPDQMHTNMGSPAGTDCIICHKHINGFRGMGGGAHTTHVTDGNGPILACADCHGTNPPPMLADGQNLSTTTVCSNCHSESGAAVAKQYWGKAGSSQGTTGSWANVEGEASFCGSCHDATPANTEPDGSGDYAPNVMGDNSTYGFNITGHGKTSGNYQKLSYQDNAATGNPAANRQCSACHDLTSSHFNTFSKRLKAGYENDSNNSNCRQCHNPETIATADPQFYTTYSAYQYSAHKNIKCSQCHDVHGSTTYAGMTKGNKQNLCNQCHSGAGGHPGVGTKAFTVNSKNYTLECISCHNVHIVTGTYNQADMNKSPVTRFSNNTNVWGDSAGEKMSDYAGIGTYRTPTGESFTGTQLPDYPTFCLDCHGSSSSGSVYFGINWSGDPHGKQSANQPNGYGTCPNWYTCGKAFGWDLDDCVSENKNDCWPVIARGAGDQLFSREAYTHTERIAGANFTLSCTDCHTGHGTGTLGRPNVNGGSFTSNWNNMCNNCHYYYSDWHAGMSCGNASCHVSTRMSQTGTSTLHSMASSSGSGGIRTVDPNQVGLVLNYRFENNLKDSGSWQMDGKWYSAAGSYAAGKSGQAAALGEDIGVQVGTENAYWSTDAGYHGTWVYTEMKFNTSLEAWVYPTDNAKSEYTIFNKHVGVSNDGGYAFTLKKIGGMLRASFSMSADNNGVAQDGRAGVRGAYSSVAVPLNKWTHVAATFDTGGADRNPSDPYVGRIRIYVNGEDVTTSDPSGNNIQPGASETSIYAYSENSPWNQSICYDGHWCASEFSIGGFDWETTNFIGRIDEAKIWNVTKNGAYFSSYASQAGPYISHAEGLIGSSQLTVRFSEGVYTNTGSSGALVPADFILTDTGGNNPKTITGVTHTAGSSTAVITMSVPLAVADVNADTLAAVGNTIYDNNNLAAGTETVTIGLSPQCPTSPVNIELNEASGSVYIMDTQNILYGTVNGGTATLTGSAYSGGGDGSGRYIMFDYNTTCLQASAAMTIETRIKPTGMAGTDNYVRRILARDGNGGYQLSVWRNNTAFPGTYSAPSGESSIALWINVVDAHGGNVWKPVLTNYTGAAAGSENNCPIVSDHWYQVKTAWNTNKPGGTPGSFFTPADIYIDDEGTDGAGAGENWSGFVNCTDTDQSLKPDASKFYTADQIISANSNFAIGTNRSTPTNNLFNGLIDWITWKDSVD